jgi:hypothetical protein
MFRGKFRRGHQYCERADGNLDGYPPPTISKAFGAATIALNGITSLSFTIINPNSAIILTGVGFTDSLPSGLVVATPNGLTGACGGGTITATAGSGSVSLSGATLAGGTSCSFSVTVGGTTPGAEEQRYGEYRVDLKLEQEEVPPRRSPSAQQPKFRR